MHRFQHGRCMQAFSQQGKICSCINKIRQESLQCRGQTKRAISLAIAWKSGICRLFKPAPVYILDRINNNGLSANQIAIRQIYIFSRVIKPGPCLQIIGHGEQRRRQRLSLFASSKETPDDQAIDEIEKAATQQIARIDQHIRDCHRRSHGKSHDQQTDEPQQGASRAVYRQHGKQERQYGDDQPH